MPAFCEISAGRDDARAECEQILGEGRIVKS